jgi:hypothetical protein
MDGFCIYGGRTFSGHGLAMSVYKATLAIVLALAVTGRADAIVVGHVHNVVPNATSSPAVYPGWIHGDPGWANFAVTGSYVYLGDGWVLSARHVGYNAAVGMTFQTASGPVTYKMAGAHVENNVLVPGPYYRDYGYDNGGTHHFAVSNPTTIQTESGTLNLSEHTDLQLFRIDGDPGLPALRISSQAMPSDFTRANAPEVVMIGGGQGRAAPQSSWNVNVHSQDNWEWIPQGNGAGSYQGYALDGAAQKHWGTNRLTDAKPNTGSDPSDPGAMDYVGLFAGIVSDSTAVLKLATPDGVTRDVITSMTIFDSQGQPGTTPAPYGVSNLEAQAIPGDSGSAVFYKRAGQWELSGIVNATFTYTDQPNVAIYGNATMMSDLWYYNQNYAGSIRNIIASHPDYSVMGDVNLDGVVSGDGSGPISSDDVAAFVAGWQYNNGTGKGTITSWKAGDLNRDGRTNVADFLKLRGALNTPISTAALSALLGGGAVPEPSALVLAVMVGAAMASIVRHRRVNEIAR